MSKSLYFRWMWFWCRFCYRTYLALPMPETHKSIYGRFMLWLLGYAGAYANSNLSNFHLCDFFYRTEEEQNAAWDRHMAALTPGSLREGT